MVFDERDWKTGFQRENERDFSEENGVSLERSQGDVSISGGDEMMESLGISEKDNIDQTNETVDELGEPIEDPNYNQIRERADYMFTINSHSHLPSDSQYELEAEVAEDPQELADELVSFLQEDGNQVLSAYIEDNSAEEYSEELRRLHLVEEDQLSNLGQYVADQVFEYSED